MVRPIIRLEESTVPGRAYDLDVYADDVRLGSIRPVADGGFVGWRWHFGRRSPTRLSNSAGSASARTAAAATGGRRR